MGTPYEILDVDKDSTKKEIKKAYRGLCQVHHPDKGGDEEAFKVIVEAYETLIDPEKRAWFDEHGSLSEYTDKNESAERNLCTIMDRIIGEHGFMADFTDLIVRMREETNEITMDIEKEIEKVDIELLKLVSISKRLKKSAILEKHMKDVISATESRRTEIKAKLPIQEIMLEMLEKAEYDNDSDDGAEQFKGFEIAFNEEGYRDTRI